MNLAILTPIIRTISHESAINGLHQLDVPLRFRAARAFA